MRTMIAVALMALLSSVALAQIPVTFQVDLRIKAKETLFDPGKDSITVHGDFMTDAGLGSNWFPSGVTMKDANKDSIYTTTVTMDPAKAGTTYHYKFTINDAAWEGDPNREFTLTTGSMTLPAVVFDRDSVVHIVATNTLNFTADLTRFYGAGVGYFDANTDSLLLQGLDWVGATVVSGARKFTEDPFSPGMFKCQMVIKGNVGDSTKWKTKAFPDSRYANGGWEFTNDKWYRIQSGGTVAEIPAFVPDIWPLRLPTAQDVKILFQVDMTTARNRYDNRSIDPKSLSFVGLKGQHSAIGAWVGDWLPTDTAAAPRTLIVLNDQGFNGDKAAGDNIWSVTVTIPKGDAGGPYLYKYGAFYPGSDTLNNAFHPGDNEMLPDINHYFLLVDQPKMEILNTFGTTSAVISGVAQQGGAVPGAFSLSQNYPNPFNPSTTIGYCVPANSRVTLVLYNMLGQRVATLFDGQQAAGSYTVVFNARDLATGLYFYKLQAGDRSAVQKMMLVK